MDTTRSQPVVFRSSAIQPGPIGLVNQGIRESWARRRLIRYLVQADVKKTGADTLLGNIWWVFDPLLQMMVYVILVTVIFARSQPDYPLFVFSAVLPWKWFTASVNDAISSVVSQERLIKQLQFPKIVLPLASTFAAVVHFLFGLIPLTGLLVLFYGDRLSPYVVLVLPIAGVQLVFSMAVALVLGALNVFVRDVGNISRHVLRLWFYLSPGLYAMSQLESSGVARAAHFLTRLLRLNPFAILFEAYRAVIYGAADTGPYPPDWSLLAGLLVVSLVLVLVAVAFFKRLEPQFAKIL
jgi:ABC-type polysaccharide/polyol phosphate export permease